MQTGQLDQDLLEDSQNVRTIPHGIPEMSHCLVSTDPRDLTLRRLAGYLLVLLFIAGTVFLGVRIRQQDLSMRQIIAHQLALQSGSALDANPKLGLLLAIEAVNLTKEHNGSWAPSAEQALRNALEDNPIPGIPLVTKDDHLEWQSEYVSIPVDILAFSPDGRWLATEQGGYTLSLFDLQDPFSQPIALSTFGAGWSGITGVAFSPEGRWIALNSDDGIVRIWDIHAIAKDPIILNLSDYHACCLSGSASFSPDEKEIALGSDGEIYFWDLDHLEAKPVALSQDGHIASLAYSPDKKWLLAGSDSSTKLWNLGTRESIDLPDVGVSEVLFSADHRWLAYRTSYTGKLVNLRRPRGTPIPLGNDVVTISFSQDSKSLLVGSWEKGLQARDLANPGMRMETLLEQETMGYWMAISPDIRWAASIQGNSVSLYTLHSPFSTPVVIHTGDSHVHNLAFSADGRWLATGLYSGEVILWDLEAVFMEPLVLDGHSANIKGALYSPDGSRMLSFSEAETTLLWDLNQPGTSVSRLSGHAQEITTAAFSPDGRWLATGSKDKTIRLWQVSDLTARPMILTGHTAEVRILAFSPDGHWLATGGSDARILLWDPNDSTGEPVVLRGHEVAVWLLAFSPDGRWLASSGPDRDVLLWDMQALQSRPRTLVGHRHTITTMRFSPDGTWLAAGGNDGSAVIWNMENLSAAPMQLGGHYIAVESLAFDPTSTWLITGSWDPWIGVWNIKHPLAEPLKLYKSGSRFGSGTRSIAFSPNGRWLAVDGDDEVASWIWDFQNLSLEPKPLQAGQDQSPFFVSFSPDGDQLLTASRETVRIWTMEIDELLSMGCRSAGRNLTQAEWKQYFPYEPYRKTCEQWP